MNNRKLPLVLILIGILMLFCSCKNTKSNNLKEPVAQKINDMDSIQEKFPQQKLPPENTIVTQPKTVVIDPGHGNHSNLEKEREAPNSYIMKIKDGGGAIGIVTKVPEYVINMKVAMKLKKLLEDKQYKVVMTKTTNEESPGNIDRAEVGNKNNAALVIRIHADSSTNSSVKGASMLVPSKVIPSTKPIYDKSKKCGDIVFETLINEVKMNNRGVVERNDMTGFNWSKVPVILVEMGFLSNREEDKLLNSDNYQDKVAAALANGIDKALNND